MKPRYIIDLDRLEATARIAKANAERLGVHLLMALKGFPLPAAFPVLLPYVEGFTASGLFESKLAKTGVFPGGVSAGKKRSTPFQIQVHAPAYQADEIAELCATCTHIVFNSLSQLALYGPEVRSKGVSIGLRINPGFSSADCLRYDPCCPDSRFGVLAEELEALDARSRERLLGLVDGFHSHALCEGYAADFAGMVDKVAEKFGPFLPRLEWLNLGGGEVIDDPAFSSPGAIAAVERLKRLHAASGGTSSPKFDVFIEPSEYLVRDSGFLEAHVLDILHREKDIAVLDISASCHATDLMLFDMRPEVVEPAQAQSGKTTILGAVSCLAGDVLGEYRFAEPLKTGDTVLFGGLGCYSFAQQSWFNGIRHPDLVLRSKAEGDRTVLSWNFNDYLREFYRVDQ